MPTTRRLFYALLFLVCGGAIRAADPIAYIVPKEQFYLDQYSAATGELEKSKFATISGRNLAISPDSTRAYVLSQQYGSVLVIDLATGNPTGSLPVGGQLNDFKAFLAVSNDGAVLYIVSEDSLYVDDIATGQQIAKVRLPFAGGLFTFLGIAVTPDRSQVYVSYQEALFAIDGTNYTLEATIPVPYGVGLAVSPKGDKLYVANGNPDALAYVIDTGTNQITATVPRGPFLATGGVLSSDGSLFYESTTKGLIALSTTSLQIVKSIPSASLQTLSVSPNGTKAVAIVNSNRLVTFDLTAGEVLSNLSALGPADNCLYTPNGTKYVCLVSPSVAYRADTVTKQVVGLTRVPLYYSLLKATSTGSAVYGLSKSPPSRETTWRT